KMVLVTFPFYKLLTIFFRFIALWYNLLYYTPFIRNRQVLGTRQDLPLGPGQMAMIQELAKETETATTSNPQTNTHDWEIIAKLINKEARPSSNLSHWFLSCISKIVVSWK